MAVALKSVAGLQKKTKSEKWMEGTLFKEVCRKEFPLTILKSVYSSMGKLQFIFVKFVQLSF